MQGVYSNFYAADNYRFWIILSEEKERVLCFEEAAVTFKKSIGYQHFCYQHFYSLNQI